MEQTEKKKRWRPSLGAYRAQENEISELREKVASLRIDIDKRNAEIKTLKRNLFDAAKGDLVGRLIKENETLRKSLDEQIEGTSRLVGECDDWREKYRELKDKNTQIEKSNDYMEKELMRIRSEEKDGNAELDELRREVEYLRNRGFWARIINK